VWRRQLETLNWRNIAIALINLSGEGALSVIA
jgi:hypothetical protein